MHAPARRKPAHTTTDHGGALLRRARIEGGLTQKQLADRLGIPAVRLSRLERGLDSTSPKMAAQIVQAIKASTTSDPNQK